MSRNYSSNAIATTLAAGCTDSATSIQVTATTGFPAADFILALDYGAAEQELVLVTNVAGTTLTVTRGYDSTTAQAHSLGAAVRHVHAAIDFRESRTHAAASTGVHGVTGAVVGTTDTQALTNKDLSSATNTLPASVLTTSSTSTLTNKTVDLTDNTVTGTLAEFNTAVSDANLASLDGTETLTNKTVSLGSNTVSGTTAQFNTALTDGDFATLAGTETLTNKTITGLGSGSSLAGDFIGGVRTEEKGSDESLSSSTTFQDDNELTISVSANAVYEVTYSTFFTGTANTSGLKTQWTGPAGSTAGTYNASSLTATPFMSSSFSPNASDNFSGAGQTTVSAQDFRLKTSATAGNLTFQFAQHTSNASAVVCKAGSYVTIRRIA